MGSLEGKDAMIREASLDFFFSSKRISDFRETHSFSLKRGAIL